MKKLHFIVLLGILLFTSCKTTKNTQENEKTKLLDPIEVIGEKSEYKGSEERKFDLIDTKLKVSFSWEKQYLFGEANLKLKPYFYNQDILELDAKGMEIQEVALLKNDTSKQALNFKYDDKILTISLDKSYTKNEEILVYIKYISKPNELEQKEKLDAISEDKGLYFINPLGEDKDKPMQIWTQGEPESNSVWFPTIDHPNERCTQEIAITVEKKFVAMSNGHIINNTENGDGTYTITWKQEKPHAPYLFMMAIGEFAEIKDLWNGMSVNYYVEKEYENVAKEIFGKTPKMLSFFSDILGVPYQWDKYWQVVVRDYVSGAMENTTAVIFGEFVQQDERELLDRSYEDIVAHELFHHWFGDLVTCESWSNLPLNESFATYGEVMWNEYEYGLNEKHLKLKEDYDAYMYEANSGKQVDMIRFQYDTPNDMFDSHSYAKGGVILNMLRTVVGDKAFYASLQNYLWTNQYQSAEIHDLRIAFEETTGQDLNWFFNQWFLSAGHPIISVNYEYTDSSTNVILKQEASKEDYLVYKLPLKIDLYIDGKIRTEEVLFKNKTQTFVFETNKKPELVNVDADKYLLAEFKDTKTEANYIYQFEHAKNLMDKIEVLSYIEAQEKVSDDLKNILKIALKDDFWFVQQEALYLINEKDLSNQDLQAIVNIAENSDKTEVQAAAYEILEKAKAKQFEDVYEKGLQSKSYRVNRAALNAMTAVNPTKALNIADKWSDSDISKIQIGVSEVYAKAGSKENVSYFQKTLNNPDINIYTKFGVLKNYTVLLEKMDNKTVLDGVSFIENWSKNEEKNKYTPFVVSNNLMKLSAVFVIKADSYAAEIKNDSGISSSQKMALENEYANIVLILDRIKEATEKISTK